VTAQPLDKHSWVAALRALERRLADNDDDADLVMLLSAANDLLQDAPLAVVELVGPLPDKFGFDGFLAAGATESAALRLLGKQGGYMISYGQSQLHMVSFILPGMESEVSAEHSVLAQAALKALVAALLELE